MNNFIKEEENKMDKLSFNALILILCFSFLNLSESKPAACE